MCAKAPERVPQDDLGSDMFLNCELSTIPRLKVKLAGLSCRYRRIFERKLNNPCELFSQRALSVSFRATSGTLNLDAAPSQTPPSSLMERPSRLPGKDFSLGAQSEACKSLLRLKS